MDCREDLFTPGSLAFSLAEEEECFLLASTEEHHRETPLDLYQQALEKRTSLSKNLPHSDPLSEKLSLAAEQFLVRRGDGGKTIIAGYHWFTDWGRDTMIALPGLCLLSGQFEMAKAILGEFRKHLSQGMLPNRFPDEGGEPEYNTIDATLWYFLALYRYVEYTNDSAFLREILPHLLDIHRWHREGTRYGIRVDSDGLLQGGDESTQLTWMDAKVGNWVVTPRHGKAVEINALWYNALQILAVFQERLGEPAAASARFREEAEQLRISFLEVFRNTNEGLLYDCVRGDHRDDRFRPNQLFALSLPFPLLEEQEAERILERMEAELLTPRGLRTLSPKHPEYQPRYLGDQLRRDGSYHQGTVWPWLLGPWATALVRFRGERGRQQAETLYRQFFDHLEEAGLGTVSEIFDGDAPHTPRGCIAQAWSVAELLRGYQEDIRGKVPQYSFSGESFT